MLIVTQVLDIQIWYEQKLAVKTNEYLEGSLSCFSNVFSIGKTKTDARVFKKLRFYVTTLNMQKNTSKTDNLIGCSNFSVKMTLPH